MIEFEVGQIYNRRRDIQDRFGGQQQGGMSTPARHPVIFLFTGESGAAHGYSDEFRPDGTFWYTGEGQRGDMAMIRANRALRDHKANHRRVHLFETAERGYVRYIGEATYLGYHTEERPDTTGLPRKAIVFELAVEPIKLLPTQVCVSEPQSPYSPRKLNRMSLDDLRLLAIERASEEASPEEHRRNVYVRSEAIRAYVLKRANGICEGCVEKAPFANKQGQPYLEPHHTTRIADGGPDHPAHVIALCPTCHRRVHYASDGDDYNQKLIAKLKAVELEV